jgi:hypothetical protein
MGLSPFAKRDTSPLAKSNRRRSSRIDYETPVILSGRDATGQAFREESVTSIVNLHGAKVRTRHQVLVGMLVTVESVKTGKVGKAVCVNTYPAEAGEDFHSIAVQVVQPGNLWGVENPPADWAEVEAELGGRSQAARAAAVPAKSAAPAPTPAPAAPVVPAPAAPVNRAPVDAQMADFEERASRMIESIMETLRVQANVIGRDFLATYEQRLTALQGEAESRLSERVEHATTELSAVVETLRTEAMAEMVREALVEYQQRLEGLSEESGNRISERIQAVLGQGEERLGRAASQSAAQTQAAQAAFERRVQALITETEKRINQYAQQAASEKGPAFAAIQGRVEAISQHIEKRIAENTSQAVGELETALGTIRSRLAESTLKADAQFTERTDKAFAEFEAALVNFRSDLEDELSARRNEAIQEVEEALRSRVAAMLSGMLGTPQDGRPVASLNAPGKK